MYNLFKNTYKIVERSNLNGEKYYNIAFCNLFTQFLPVDKWMEYYGDDRFGFFIHREYAKSFTSLEEVKLAIKKHQEKLLSERLSKVISKTIARI